MVLQKLSAKNPLWLEEWIREYVTLPIPFFNAKFQSQLRLFSLVGVAREEEKE